MDKLCKIRDIQRSIIHFELRFEKEFGICLNEGMALCSLNKSGSLSSGEMGELLGLTASNTSKVIRSVEKKGFIKRNMGDKDKRQMYFSLTRQGQQLIDSIHCHELELSPLLHELLEK